MLLENFTYPEDTRVRNEAESLAAAGHGVTVLAPRGAGSPHASACGESRCAVTARCGPEARRCPTSWSTGSPTCSCWRARCAALLRGADVLHFNGPPDTLAVAGLLARLAGREVVYDMHDSGPELFEAKFGSSPAAGVLRVAQRAAIRCANQVIVTNETQRELAIARGPAPHWT